VILDAGSSGTRVHVYRWLNSSRAIEKADSAKLHSLPELKTEKKWTLKIKPGVSTFGDRPADVGREHLQELLDHALSVVPEDQVEDTPLFLMATAGVRLLEPMQQSALLSEICSYAQQHTKFSLPDCGLHIQVIPGETEGLYGWIAANYLLGGFDAPEKHNHGKGHHTYGFLDMGGASAQIAFAPNTTEAEKHANDLKLLRMRTLDGRPSEYKVFSATWLGFGVNQARERYVERLMDASYTHDAKELPDPCLPTGLKTTLAGVEVEDGTNVGSETILLGTGLFDECLKATYPLLGKDAPCEDHPCLLNGQHVPAIDFDVNHFVGVSEYWHTTHSVFKMDDKSYDLETYQRLVKDFCSEEWEDIEGNVLSHKWGKKVDAKTAQEVCFKASWLINVLHQGIGIPRVGIEKSAHAPGFNETKELKEHTKEKGFLDPFQAVDKIDDMEVSWTLGKMVLYAAGQIPPALPEALPVGFGSNIDGVVPADFQEAGSNSIPVPVGDDDDWTEAAEDLVEKAHSKSNAGFLLFMLILIVVGYIFRKRERRLRFYRRVDTTFRRHRRPGSPRKSGRSFFGAGKLFGNRSSGNYERVEVGEAADFELAEADSDDNEHSDSSEGSRLGRTSGLATSKLSVVNFDPGTYFDKHANVVQGLGLGSNNGGSVLPNAMDRSGLVVRTESRERLGPTLQMLGAGRRSRTGSPTRLKSPMMTPLEEV
jgi:Golgi apyrase